MTEDDKDTAVEATRMLLCQRRKRVSHNCELMSTLGQTERNCKPMTMPTFNTQFILDKATHYAAKVASKSLVLIAAAILLGQYSAPAAAQQVTASIVGTVKDPQDALVVGAAVRATNLVIVF